jgi:hypothetical protein
MMAYYIREAPVGYTLLFGKPTEVWKIDETKAVRLGMANPGVGLGTCYTVENGGDIWEELKQKIPNNLGPYVFPKTDFIPFHKTVLEPGRFYPRIHRPLVTERDNFHNPHLMRHEDIEFVAIARSQLVALTRQLDLICQTIHPDEKTFESYGHTIRNLLILACTEVETHWRGILVANNLKKRQYRTTDYVKLQIAMKLGEFAMQFPSFPWLEPVRPFEKWGTSGNTTQDLAWYDAYNQVKHNREQKFHLATLRQVFDAVSACVIMMVAQFGTESVIGSFTELGSFFHLSSVPEWPASHHYMPPFEEAEKSTPINYPF